MAFHAQFGAVAGAPGEHMSATRRILQIATAMQNTSIDEVEQGRTRGPNFKIAGLTADIRHLHLLATILLETAWSQLHPQMVSELEGAAKSVRDAIHALREYDPANEDGKAGFDGRAAALRSELSSSTLALSRTIASVASLASLTPAHAERKNQLAATAEAARNSNVEAAIGRMEREVNTKIAHLQRTERSTSDITTRLEERATAANERVQTTMREAQEHVDAAKRIRDEIATISQDAVIAANATVFGARATACEASSTWWFRSTMVAVIATTSILVSLALYYSGLLSAWLPEPATTANWPLVAVQASLVSLGYFLVVYSARNQRAFLHSAAVNRQRANALSAYRVLSEAVKEDQSMRNLLVATVTRAIFDPRSTGFTAADVEIKAPSPVDKLLDAAISKTGAT